MMIKTRWLIRHDDGTGGGGGERVVVVDKGDACVWQPLSLSPRLDWVITCNHFITATVACGNGIID